MQENGGIMKNKKTISLILSGALMIAICSFQTPIHASTIDELENRIEQIQQENAQRQEKIEDLKDDLSQYESYASAVQSQIDGVNSEMSLYNQLITDKQALIDEHSREIELLEQEIKDNEAEIEAGNAEIELLNQQNQDNLEIFGETIAALYKSGNVDYLTVLAGSDSFYDMLVKIRLMNGIAEQNQQFMDKLMADIHTQEAMIVQLNDKIAQLETQKMLLNSEKQTLEDEMEVLQAEKDAIVAKASDYYDKLYQYSQGIDSLESQVSSLKSEINASNEQIEELNRLIEDIIRQEQQGDNPVYSTDGFIWPLSSSYQYITTYFGYDAWRGSNHYGIDVGNAGIGGANIYAAQSGTVIVAKSDNGWNGGFGNYVIIDHGDGVSTLYAHMQENSVTVYKGQSVQVGQVIGKVGTTGWSTGNHLHFEVRINGTAVNPFNYSYSYVY